MYSKYGDIVFENVTLTETLNTLEDIRRRANEFQSAYIRAKNTYLDGEDTLEFKPPYIGVTAFLRGLTTQDNNLLTPEFRELEYWKRKILIQMNQDFFVRM